MGSRFVVLRWLHVVRDFPHKPLSRVFLRSHGVVRGLGSRPSVRVDNVEPSQQQGSPPRSDPVVFRHVASAEQLQQ